MNESLKTGIGLTGFVCAAGYIIGGINALFACIVFCGMLWAYEIKARIHGPQMQVENCKVCGCKVGIRDKTYWQFNNKICPLCIDKIFKYSND